MYFCSVKIELLEKGNEQQNLLRAALQQSNILCSTRYNKPIRTSGTLWGYILHMSVFLKQNFCSIPLIIIIAIIKNIQP